MTTASAGIQRAYRDTGESRGALGPTSVSGSASQAGGRWASDVPTGSTNTLDDNVNAVTDSNRGEVEGRGPWA